MFNGFVLRANSLGHLEQIESYAPNHQVRCGSQNYTADIRVDLIFNGFEPLPCASRGYDEYDLALPSDSVKIAPAAASTLNSEEIVPSEDGWMDAATKAAHSSAIEPNTDLTSNEVCVIGPSDFFPAIGSEPLTSVPLESDWAPIMEFTSADILQHSPFGDIPNSLRDIKAGLGCG